MKVLVYTASSICNPQFGIQMERAIEYYKGGNEVLFCHCAGAMRACSANPRGNKAYCHFCQKGFNAGLKNLPPGIKVEQLKKRKPHKDYQKKEFTSVSDLKSYQYKGIDVGFSVFSVYVTFTRNPNPIFSEVFLNSLNQLLYEAESLIDSAEQIVNRFKPDLIIVFNGRFFDTKPFYGWAINNGIDFITTENIGGVRTETEYRMVEFHNTIPHDARQAYKNCLLSWDVSSENDADKRKKGEAFFKNRRSGIKAGDYVYTSNQVEGKLPNTYSPNMKNVVVFCSSEDEFSSVSKEVDSYYLFESQYAAIKYIVENIQDEGYHFYVRIHPNMKGLNVEYHLNLYKLAEYENVTVIGPENNVSSYALMDIANNIVVFGSTIGAESLYWGKSVVLLGYASYYYWGCCLIPNSKQEVIEMIKTPKSYPQAKDIATKFGYYLLENGLSEKAKYINITPKKIHILNKGVFAFQYLKLWHSSTLYQYCYYFYTKFLALFFKSRIPILN